jgi:hypothetical protein
MTTATLTRSSHRSLGSELAAEKMQAEVSTLIQRHEGLRDCLLRLQTVSTLQLDAATPRAWQTILVQKQQLLDYMETLNTEELFAASKKLMQAPALVPGEDGELLRRCADENMALLHELAQIEASAEAHLRKQTEELRTALCRSQQKARVSHTYRDRRQQTTTPRFLDSVR